MQEIVLTHIIPLTLMIRWEMLYERMNWIENFEDIEIMCIKDEQWIDDLGLIYIACIENNKINS